MSMPKLIKNGRFWPFWSIRAENDQKWTPKMVQKMSHIFFQYQDFLKSRYPGFFSKPVFCPCPFGRESRYWRKNVTVTLLLLYRRSFFLSVTAWHKNPGTRYWRALGYQEMSRCDTFFQKSWYWRKKSERQFLLQGASFARKPRRHLRRFLRTYVPNPLLFPT